MVPFKSATIVASSGGKLFVGSYSVIFFAAHGGNLFWFLFSHHLLMPHFGGWLVFCSFKSETVVASSGGKLFLVPLQSASINAAFGGKLVFGSF